MSLIQSRLKHRLCYISFAFDAQDSVRKQSAYADPNPRTRLASKS